MSKFCIECGEKLTDKDSEFVKKREQNDNYDVRLFDHETCASCITSRESVEDESVDYDPSESYNEVYSENLDQEFLMTENAYQGYNSLGALDGTYYD